MGRRLIENTHSTRDRSMTYLAHTDARMRRRRRRRRFNVSGVLVLNNPPASYLKSVKAFSLSKSPMVIKMSGAFVVRLPLHMVAR
jgi:hypothetical protein